MKSNEPNKSGRVTTLFFTGISIFSTREIANNSNEVALFHLLEISHICERLEKHGNSCVNLRNIILATFGFVVTVIVFLYLILGPILGPCLILESEYLNKYCKCYIAMCGEQTTVQSKTKSPWQSGTNKHEYS